MKNNQLYHLLFLLIISCLSVHNSYAETFLIPEPEQFSKTAITATSINTTTHCSASDSGKSDMNAPAFLLPNLFIDASLLDQEVLAQATAGETNNTYHLFSHGRPGELLINNQWRSAKEIAIFLNKKLKANSKKPKAINIYGCNFAQGEKGLTAVRYLEKELGIAFAASTNITGKDGDWILEIGSNLKIPNLSNYNGNLQSISASNGTPRCSNCVPVGWAITSGTPDISDANIAADFSSGGGAGATWVSALPLPPNNHTDWISIRDLGSTLTEEIVNTTVTELTPGLTYEIIFYTLSALTNQDGSTYFGPGNGFYAGTYIDQLGLQINGGAIQFISPVTQNAWGTSKITFLATASTANITFRSGTNGTYVPGTNAQPNERSDQVETIQISVSLNAVNAVPVANNDDASTCKNAIVDINIVNNDNDSDGLIDPATVDLNVVSSGIQNSITTTEGSWSVNSLGIVTFTPTNGFVGTATLNYTVDDNFVLDGISRSATSNAATINVSVGDGLDTDLDGISDICDLDDDNDGIQDFYEFDCLASTGLISEEDSQNATSNIALLTNAIYDDQASFFGTEGGYLIIDLSSVLPANREVEFYYTFDIDAGGLEFEVSEVTNGVFVNGGGDNQVTLNSSSQSTEKLTYILSQSTRYLQIQLTFKSVITEANLIFHEVEYRTENCTALDSDSDGIDNHLDLDSDNDEIPDNIEGIATQNYIFPGSFTDANSDGLNDVYASLTSPVDTDEDGIRDFLDLDSDNDNLFDIAESGLTNNDTDDDGMTNSSVGANGLDNGLETSDDFSNVEGLAHDGTNFLLADYDADVSPDGSNANGSDIDLDFREVVDTCNAISGLTDTDGDTVTDICDLDNDNDGILDVEEKLLCQNSVNNLSVIDFVGVDPANFDRIDDGVTSGSALFIGAGQNFNGSNYILVDLSVEIQAGRIINIYLSGTAEFNSYTARVSEVPSGSYAAGGGDNQNTFTNGSTFVNATTLTYTLSQNTRYIQLEITSTGPFGGAFGVREIEYTTADCLELDTDNDSIPNHFDLDSDNDGIPDNVEAQTTPAYLAPNADDEATYRANAGINTAYLGGLNPIDTEGDTTPDYLDGDSDNDGINDVGENYTPVIAVTTVGTNGLENAADTADDYSDVNGITHDGTSFSASFADTDADVSSGGDYDYRDLNETVNLFGTRIISSLQNGTVTPNKIDAYLNIVSNNWGVVITRVNGVASITNAVEGMLVFDTSDNTFKVNTDGTATGWRALKE